MRPLRRSRLAIARSLLPRLLAADPEARAACGTRWAVRSADVTSTGVAVLKVGDIGERLSAVVRLAMTRESVAGVEHEGRILDALHADRRLADWCRLVPRVRASGIVDGYRYRVDTALSGHAPLDRVSDESGRGRMLESAADSIHALHRTSAVAVNADAALVAHWVDEPIADLVAHGGARGAQARLNELRDELHDALAGRAVFAGWIHGDYWLGNVLVEDGALAPQGIVDWDAASPHDLPALDVLHLLLYTRRLATGRELGAIVTEHLHGGSWPRDEGRILDAYAAWSHPGGLSSRDLLLLCWLRHVAHHARQQGNGRGLVYERWRHMNVRPVLEAL